MSTNGNGAPISSPTISGFTPSAGYGKAHHNGEADHSHTKSTGSTVTASSRSSTSESLDRFETLDADNISLEPKEHHATFS